MNKKINMCLLAISTLVFFMLVHLMFKSTFAESSLASQLYNGDEWNNYRLGDVYDKYDIIPYEWDVRYHTEKFPNTIASEYIKRNVPIIKRNKKLMLEIIKEHNYPNILTPDDLVLHIRTGDIMCEYNKKHEDWSRKNDDTWWNNVKNYISENNIKQVYILSGAHLKQCLDESAEYLENRKKFLQNDKIKINYRVGKPPDDDVLFSSNATHFISTGGQYGMLLNEFRKSPVSSNLNITPEVKVKVVPEVKVVPKVKFTTTSLLSKSSFGQINSVDSVNPLKPVDLVYSLYKTKFKKRFITNGNKGKLNTVDMVYCITMPQRKQYITERMNDLDVNCKYLDAVKPTDLTDNEYNILSNINQQGSNIYHKFTRLPVLLSFVMCFIDALTNNYDNIIIFEDDITIDINKRILNESLGEFNKSSMEIFFMGYCYLDCNQIYNINRYNYLIEVGDRNILCCHAICIKTRILAQLINYCFPMKQNSDELFRNFFMQQNINVCVPKIPYFSQNRIFVESLNESYDELKTCSFN